MIKLEVSLQELKWIYLGLGWYDTEGRRFDDPDREEFERFTDKIKNLLSDEKKKK